MDSLEWFKQYPILSITRAVLTSLGFSREEVALLTDEEMEQIASKLLARVAAVMNFDEEVRIAARAVLVTIPAEGEQDGQS